MRRERLRPGWNKTTTVHAHGLARKKVWPRALKVFHLDWNIVSPNNNRKTRMILSIVLLRVERQQFASIYVKCLFWKG